MLTGTSFNSSFHFLRIPVLAFSLLAMIARRPLSSVRSSVSQYLSVACCISCSNPAIRASCCLFKLVHSASTAPPAPVSGTVRPCRTSWSCIANIPHSLRSTRYRMISCPDISSQSCQNTLLSYLISSTQIPGSVFSLDSRSVPLFQGIFLQKIVVTTTPPRLLFPHKFLNGRKFPEYTY